MIDIKKILLDNGIDEGVASECANAIKQEIPKDFVSKVQYKKKTDEIDTLNGKIADLEIDVQKAGTDEYKSKYETLETEFKTYKNNIETEKVNGTKKNKLTELLKKEGANEKLVGLLLKEFDLEKIEIDGDNIKDWDNVIKPVKEGYSDCFATVETVGNPPATPPQNNPSVNQPTSLAGALHQKYNM